jgi:YD repeat-containing protein
MPTGTGCTAHVPMKAGPGGEDRPGWFVNRYAYDLLDNRIEEDLDATGSTPSRLVATYEYDPNCNLVKITKPEGNTIENDYDERDLLIATRVGYVQADEPEGVPKERGAVTINVYDGNGNLIDRIGPADRLAEHHPAIVGGSTTLTATIEDAFRSGDSLTHTGTWDLETTYDGFDRATQTVDAVGNVVTSTHDPDGRVVEVAQFGLSGGPSPENRAGAGNVILSRLTRRFDEAGLPYEVQRDVFLNTGIGNGHQLPSKDLPSPEREVTHTGGGLEANSTTDSHTAPATLTNGDESYVLTRAVLDRSNRLAVEYPEGGHLQPAHHSDGRGGLRVLRVF